MYQRGNFGYSRSKPRKTLNYVGNRIYETWQNEMSTKVQTRNITAACSTRRFGISKKIQMTSIMPGKEQYVRHKSVYNWRTEWPDRMLSP
jgi:hypothetical protein